MRARFAIAFLLLLLAPVALADQVLRAGPARGSTSNVDSGDACGGGNGQHSRTILVDVQIDSQNKLEAAAYQTCYSDTGHGYDTRSAATAAYVERAGPGNSNGPFVDVFTGTYSDPYSMQCQSVVGGLGVFLQPGCLTLDGSQPPMVPPLP